jgi:hypothetical protein
MRSIVKVLFFIAISTSASAQNQPQQNESKVSGNHNEIQLDSSKYATLHLYRPKNAVGGLVGYNIKLDDSTICKLKNNRKFSIRLYKEGPVKIWPSNEDRKIDIKVKFGEEYFVKFAMVSGLVGAHPELNLINSEQGRVEFDSIEDKKARNSSND